jgi:spermidine synthase
MAFTNYTPDPPGRLRWTRISLGLLVGVWGAQAIITQTLLLREALVLMYGTELVWGLVLFAWLLGVALGAKFGACAAGTGAGRRRPEILLVLVLTLLSAVGVGDLWVFRGARAWLGVGPGELLPLPSIAACGLLFVLPAGLLVGMAFPLACSIRIPNPAAPDRPADKPRALPALSFAQIYALESLGSLIGGAALSFWAVEHLNPLQTSLFCGAATTAVAAALVAAGAVRGHAPRPAGARAAPLALAAGCALAAVVLAGVAVSRGDSGYARLVERRWRNIAPGYELIAEVESRYQNLALGRRADQYSLYCDGHATTDFPDPYTFAPLAHFWLCQHPAPQRVLILGGGAEGLLAEVLRHPVQHVDCVETDPRLLTLIRPYLGRADQRALEDPRVTVHHADARHYVKTQRNRFDLVIARLPEPTSALNARFYTDEFFRELRTAMTPRATLVLTAAATPTELSRASREYLAVLRATIQRHFAEIIVGWGDPAPILAGTVPGLVTTDPHELTARYRQRGVAAEHFDPLWFEGATDWLDPVKVNQRARELATVLCPPIGTDLHPRLYVQRLALWEAATGKSRVVASLQRTRVWQVVAGLVLLGVLTLVTTRVRRGGSGWASGAVTLSVGSTGLVTMALSLVWLYAFQNLYGYVYQRLGWIIALFMAGLVAGCLLGDRLVRARTPRESKGPEESGFSPAVGPRMLILADLLLALLSVCVPLILRGLGTLPGGPATLQIVETCISLMVVATGILGGVTFPLGAHFQARFVPGTGAVTGSVVGADHAGACLGALLCGVLLVPVFGTVTTACLLGAMKAATAGVLALTWRRASIDWLNLRTG